MLPTLTVLENVRLAVQSRAGLGRDLWSMWGRHVELVEKAEHTLHRVGLAERRDAIVSALPHGDQRKLDISCHCGAPQQASRDHRFDELGMNFDALHGPQRSLLDVDQPESGVTT